MKKSGLQFVNYIYLDKVIKKRKSLFGVIRKNIQWHRKKLLRPIKLFKDSLNYHRYTKRQYETIRKRKDLYKILGIVKWDDKTIIQEKFTTIAEYFENHSLSENKKMIKKYFGFVKQCWKNGFFEEVFNFTINNGITKSGEIKLLDVGEISFEKEKMKKCIKEKRWLKQWSYTSMKNKALKDYYKKESLKFFTLKNLNKYWKN